jgi:hypothetical protein
MDLEPHRLFRDPVFFLLSHRLTFNLTIRSPQMTMAL